MVPWPAADGLLELRVQHRDGQVVTPFHLLNGVVELLLQPIHTQEHTVKVADTRQTLAVCQVGFDKPKFASKLKEKVSSFYAKLLSYD